MNPVFRVTLPLSAISSSLSRLCLVFRTLRVRQVPQRDDAVLQSTAEETDSEY